MKGDERKGGWGIGGTLFFSSRHGNRNQALVDMRLYNQLKRERGRGGEGESHTASFVGQDSVRFLI